MKNGTPIKDVIIPIGISIPFIKILDKSSHKTKTIPPKIDENGIEFICFSPIKILEIWGTINPINPIIPLKATVIEARIDEKNIISI